MSHHVIPTADPRAGLPRCLDCGGRHRHDDSCPARQDLLDLFDADVAALAARPPGRVYVRGLDRVERAHLQAAGVSAPRHERHRWSVRVRSIAGGVRRAIFCDGHPVAEIDDTDADGGVE